MTAPRAATSAATRNTGSHECESSTKAAVTGPPAMPAHVASALDSANVRDAAARLGATSAWFARCPAPQAAEKNIDSETSLSLAEN